MPPSAPVPITPSAVTSVSASTAISSPSVECEGQTEYSRTPTTNSGLYLASSPHLDALDSIAAGTATTAAIAKNNASNRPWIVQKYGGTSVGKFLPAISRTIAPEFLRRNRLAIVCSARSTGTKAGGTTSLLLAAAEQALSAEDDTPEASLSGSVASLSSAREGRASLSRNSSRTGVRTPADLQGVTAGLQATSLETVSQATQSSSDKTVDRIMREHIDAARSIVTKDAAALEQLELDIQDDCERLRDLLLAAKIIEEVSPRSKDMILSIGERLSCRLMVGALGDAGVPAELIGLETIIDAAFLEELSQRGTGTSGQAEGALEQSFYELLAARIGERVSQANATPVITGYFGNVPGSLLSQVGRGYTDLCAALCAVGLAAEELQIWKEVDGVFTADPRKVPTARLIPAITPEEASELTYYGSEVIHPFTMEQAIKRRVPIRIKNVENPTGLGTVIFPAQEIVPGSGDGTKLKQPETPSASGSSTPWGVSSDGAPFNVMVPAATPAARKLPTAVTIKDDVWVLNVHSNRKTLSHGFFARIFSTLDKHGIVVDLISTSEVHVSMALASGQPGLKRPRALDRVKSELGSLGTVSVLREMAILSLVGTQMRHMVGVAGKMFSTLAEGNINIEMISQGANEINISCVIHQKSALKALNLIHYSVLEVSPTPNNRESGTFGRSFF